MGPAQVFQKGKQSFKKLSMQYRFHKQNVAQKSILLFFPSFILNFVKLLVILKEKSQENHSIQCEITEY